MRLAWTILVAASCCLGQDALKRDGLQWLATTAGTVPGTGVEKLKVSTRGGVIVQGDDEPTVRYVLKKRSRMRSEADARTALRSIRLRPVVTRGLVTLNVLGLTGSSVSADVELRVPRSLGHVIVETRDGRVELYDVAGTAEVESGAGSIQMDRIGGDVIARTGGGEIRMGTIGGAARILSAGGSIVVDRVGAESWFQTAGGEVIVGESKGPIHASTAGGNIRVAQAGSSVAAHASGGRIEVQRAAGTVTAENASGSIQVGQADGVRCESSGGTIRLRGTSGELQAVTDVGSIMAELVPGVPLRDSILSTGSGDITVFIPSNLAVTVRAQNDSGRPGKIYSDFPEIPVKLARAARTRLSFAEGSLNGGGPVLRISVASGTIYLRRQR